MRSAENWTVCTVAAVRDLTARVREITLDPESGVQPYSPGSHVDVKVLVDGQPETRSYSLIGSDSGSYRIAVQLAAEGHGGSRYMWSLGPGARIAVSLPSNLFEVDWGRHHYSLIAGGIGITPLIGIAETLARRQVDYTLHYCVASRREAAYLDTLSALHGEKLLLHVSDEGSRLDLDAIFAKLPAGGTAALCGPMRLLDAARRSWAAAGRSPIDLVYETFGSSGLLSTEVFTVRIGSTGEEIVVPANRSMLAVLNDAGHEVMSDCESGECGVCAINVISHDGEIDHRDVFFSAEQRQKSGKICPCVSRAHGTITVDTLYRPDAIERG